MFGILAGACCGFLPTHVWFLSLQKQSQELVGTWVLSQKKCKCRWSTQKSELECAPWSLGFDIASDAYLGAVQQAEAEKGFQIAFSIFFRLI